MSVLRVSVTVECGVWTLDYESAVSGEPPSQTDVAHIESTYGHSQPSKRLKMKAETFSEYCSP